MTVEPPQGCIPAPYRRRRPDKTLLFYESAPLAHPQCGADMKIIAFVTESVSVRRLGRFAILLRFEGQDVPSLDRSLDGTKIHRTFVLFRLALEHIGEPADPPRIAPARPCATSSALRNPCYA